MSGDLFRLGAKFRSIAEQRAVTVASAARKIVRPDAYSMAVAAMPGVHAALWAVGVAPSAVSNPRIISVGEPRNWRDQLSLWQQVGAVLVPYGQACWESNKAPQIVVSTRQAWEVIEANAERLCRADDEMARGAAELIMFVSERANLPGSQCLVVASELLNEHVATGSEDGDEAGLGTMLAWTTGDPSRLADRLAKATQYASELWTPVEIDRNVLVQQVTKYNRHRAEAKHEMAKILGKSIEKELSPIVKDRHNRIRVALSVFNRLGLPGVKEISTVAEEDADAWSRWMSSRQMGVKVARKDSPKAAVLGLMAREDAAEQWERALLWNDDFYLRAAAASGTVLEGEVVTVGFDTIAVRSQQEAVRVRGGEELVWRSDARTKVKVETLNRTGDDVIYELRLLTQKGAVPETGRTVIMCPSPPDYGSAVRKRVQAASRLKTMPWTHNEAPAPSVPPRAVPTDILALAENLRS